MLPLQERWGRIHRARLRKQVSIEYLCWTRRKIFLYGELIMSYLVHKMSHLSSLLSLRSKQRNNNLLCFMFGAKKRMKICCGLAVNNISIFSNSLFLGDEMLTINNFLFNAQIDNINLFKVKDENQSNHLFSPFQIKLQTSALIVTPLSLSVAEVLWEEHDQQKGKPNVIVRIY